MRGGTVVSAMNLAILWPTVALAGLIFVVWSILLRKRFAHIAVNRPTAADFANAEAVGRYFRPVERPAQNLANLFEMPVLFYVLVVSLFPLSTRAWTAPLPGSAGPAPGLRWWI